MNFTFDDFGDFSITAKYKDLSTSIDVTVVGPNLRTTEKDSSHFFLRTKDGYYLSIGEDSNE